MELKGAVLIIGSLLWEDETCCNKEKGEFRKKWRSENLKIEESKSVLLPIRYGRISSSRFKTYTMIFCNSVTDERSKGFIIPIKVDITTENGELLNQARLMSVAEGFSNIISKSGAIAMMLNPNFLEVNQTISNIIIDAWSIPFKNTSNNFDSSRYSSKNGYPTVIDENGMLKIKWAPEFDNYHFILASPTVPEPGGKVEASVIAEAMHKSKGKGNIREECIGKEYTEYFVKNRCSGITTFQDEEIMVEYKRLTNKEISNCY